VRLVASDGQQVGITPLPEALQMARDLDLDLVEVAPLANPPVCRIMDYGKYKYEEAQRARESRRKSSAVAIKEMKYRPKIGIGDFDTKTRKVSEFLAEGHKVKVTIMFRGREVFHPELGKKILDQVAERVVEVGKVEAAPRLDGRNMTMVLAPDKRAQAKRSSSHRDAAPAAGPTSTAPRPTSTAPAPSAAAPSAPAPSAAPEPSGQQPPEPVVVADSEAAPTA
jgi:translation initiation factor IF-3